MLSNFYSANVTRTQNNQTQQPQVSNFQEVYELSDHTLTTNDNMQQILQQLEQIDSYNNMKSLGSSRSMQLLSNSNQVSNILERTNKEIKMMNNQISRLIASKQESFIILEHNVERYIDVLENVPVYASIQLIEHQTSDEEVKDSKLQLPLNMSISNVHTNSDI